MKPGRPCIYPKETREERRRESMNKRHEWVRLRVLYHYSYGEMKCACCGENRVEFLSVNHLLGDGAKHRKENKIVMLPEWLDKNHYPDGFNVLCMNCNFALGHYGYCPHKK